MNMQNMIDFQVHKMKNRKLTHKMSKTISENALFLYNFSNKIHYKLEFVY